MSFIWPTTSNHYRHARCSHNPTILSYERHHHFESSYSLRFSSLRKQIYRKRLFIPLKMSSAIHSSSQNKPMKPLGSIKAYKYLRSDALAHVRIQDLSPKAFHAFKIYKSFSHAESHKFTCHYSLVSKNAFTSVATI